MPRAAINGVGSADIVAADMIATSYGADTGGSGSCAPPTHIQAGVSRNHTPSDTGWMRTPGAIYHPSDRALRAVNCGFVSHTCAEPAQFSASKYGAALDTK